MRRIKVLIIYTYIPRIMGMRMGMGTGMGTGMGMGIGMGMGMPESQSMI